MQGALQGASTSHSLSSSSSSSSSSSGRTIFKAKRSAASNILAPASIQNECVIPQIVYDMGKSVTTSKMVSRIQDSEELQEQLISPLKIALQSMSHNVNAKYKGSNALLIAIVIKPFALASKTLQLLMDYGANPADPAAAIDEVLAVTPDTMIITPLHRAVAYRNDHMGNLMINILLSKNKELIDLQDENRNTPLISVLKEVKRIFTSSFQEENDLFSTYLKQSAYSFLSNNIPSLLSYGASLETLKDNSEPPQSAYDIALSIAYEKDRGTVLAVLDPVLKERRDMRQKLIEAILIRIPGIPSVLGIMIIDYGYKI
jgi:hypothetical protein